MAFPLSPSDGQLYTSSLNTVYKYEAATGRWLLYSHTMVGETGLQGVTGLVGATGLAGAQGTTGSQGVTGLQGLTGASGTSGGTGLQGTTGIGTLPSDATFNSVLITGNSSGATGIVVNTMYGTTAPPSPTGIAYGTIYIQYVS